MTKFIKLTNVREDIKGSPLYFNPDHITCVYDLETENGEKTFVYGGNPSQTWEVEETAKQVMSLLQGTVSIWDGKINE
jgi:hypothetical protein